MIDQDLALLRAYEPVLIHTQGEMFLPCAVDEYLHHCSMWISGVERGDTRIAEPGQITRDTLGEWGSRAPVNGTTYLRFVQKPMDWRQYLSWRSSADRPHFSAVGRWSRVGMFSRLVDAGFDISVALRGVVPGGTTAIAEQQFRAMSAGPDGAAGHPPPTYYGRVVREGGWVALQYWFFYVMNDFRSSFNGVNDHEGDWEQIIVYLPESAVDAAAPHPPTSPPSWVAFAAHDLTGDDLRRRSDDPELQLHDGRHPVVFVGAGSHASYFSPGEYLFAVSPRVLTRISDAASRLQGLWRESLGQGVDREHDAHEQLPWSVPFLDYARGDGIRIGPGEALSWSPVRIDGSESWVADYRGLWGLDTRDPLGGERAPAGPKFDRDGSVRRSWNDVLGFSGMDKVIPEGEWAKALVARTGRLRLERDELGVSIGEARQEVRDQELDRLAVETTSASSAAAAPLAEQELEAEERLNALVRRRGEIDESLRATGELERRLVDGVSTDPRAHIAHEHRPQPIITHMSWLAETWAALSGGLLLIVVVTLAFSDVPHRFVAMGFTIVAFLGLDAMLRGRGIRFLLNYTITMAIAGTLILMIGYWRLAIILLAIFIVYSTVRGNLSELRSLRAARRRSRSSAAE